jgi:hypothetical protein
MDVKLPTGHVPLMVVHVVSWKIPDLLERLE